MLNFTHIPINTSVYHSLKIRKKIKYCLVQYLKNYLKFKKKSISRKIMDNLSSADAGNLSSSIQDLPSLDQLLDTLGFTEWNIIIATFAIPSISLVGIVLCSLSAWIFFQPKFKDPVFYYYRLLSIVYIIHLAHNIPRGLLSTPRYLPQINTYLSCIYLIYHAFMSIFLFHFEETLQIGILLTRMKIFSPYVKKHFNALPRNVSIAFFLTCLLIDFSAAFLFKISSFGAYSYDDTTKKQQQTTATLYYYVPSDFSQTLLGQFLLTFSLFFLNYILSIIVGVTLNIVSLLKYKSYVKARRLKEESYNVGVQMTSQAANGIMETNNDRSREQEVTQKELNEKRAEKNLFYMAVTLSSISILSRCLIILSGFFFQFSSSLSTNLILTNISNVIYI